MDIGMAYTVRASAPPGEGMPGGASSEARPPVVPLSPTTTSRISAVAKRGSIFGPSEWATLRAMTRLSKAAQDGIVVDLAVDGQNLTEDKFDELCNQLDADHKMEVRQNIREFVDNAVGSEHWDSDR
jgi:hypothetical protein